jgi:hypothetical protein
MHGKKTMQVMHALFYLTQQYAFTHRWVHIMLTLPATNNLQRLSMTLPYSMVGHAKVESGTWSAFVIAVCVVVWVPPGGEHAVARLLSGAIMAQQP